MKRLLSLLLSLVCVLLPAGCRDEDEAPPLVVTSNGEEAAPYVNLLWSLNWTGDGWLSADCGSISDGLPEICDELEAVTYSDDFSVQHKDGVSFSSLSVFDAAFDRIHHSAGLSLLEELPEGNYYISIVVSSQDRYIASEDNYETSGRECVFKFIK